MASYDPRTDLPAVTRAGWQCPECRTVYSPDISACHCATVRKSLSERIAIGPPPNFGGTCTCTQYGPSSMRCPVHPPLPVQVIC